MRISFVNKLIELADNDKDIFLLTGDLGFDVFEKYIEKFPERFINCGLAEQHMIGVAAGLALKNKKVFVYSIIPFITYRVLEQIRNDLCYQKLPVKIIGIGSGLVYGTQGGTHHAIEDIGVMTSLPDIYVFSPADPLEVERIIEKSLKLDCPCYIRLNRAGDPVVHTEASLRYFELSVPCNVYGEGQDVIIFAVGNMVHVGVEVLKELEKRQIKGSVHSVHTLKPVNEKSILELLKKASLIVTLEEHIPRNGLASLISFIAAKNSCSKKFLPFYLKDSFIHDVGSWGFLRKRYGLNKEEILEKIIKSMLENA